MLPAVARRRRRRCARAVSVRPEPSSPARPTISPRRTSSDTPRSRGRADEPVGVAAAVRDSPSPSSRRARRRIRSRRCRNASRDLPSMRHTRSSRSSPASGRVADELAVAQHGHAVADRVQLVEAMADVDDRRALRLQRADQRRSRIATSRSASELSARRARAPSRPARRRARWRPSAAARCSARRASRARRCPDRGLEAARRSRRSSRASRPAPSGAARGRGRCSRRRCGGRADGSPGAPR